MAWITLAGFTDQTQLSLAKNLLEASGIRSFVSGEFTNQTAGYLNFASGGAQLRVQEADYAQAFELLQQAGFLNENDLLPDLLLTDLNTDNSAKKIVANQAWKKLLLLAAALLILCALVFLLLLLLQSV